ncbi:hypothetical protein Val02_90320 [Virgisporangium aliadipatigenens]|uniref:DUF2017 domain-containing protein n=1 Tax=Virgisporangium aliadipatigenens TaxID=741659 RepID=A0A8J3YYN7_9ACTN|nr:DUF2017 domain-containing protein [Virgisporangium aliadipatigenens]GIJ52146.1 hypothetical protein Val02_90320 [Virgisporangium aliadipatigenens]
MTVFARRGTGCVARLDAVETQVLQEVLTQVVDLLSEGHDLSDPVMARLFPDVYPDDAETSADLRRYTDDDLKAAKLEQAGTVLGTLPEGGGVVRLDEEQAESWLRALTDARLALGMRLDVRDDTDLEAEIDAAVARDPGSARVQQLSVYGFLTLLQVSLVEALVGY